MRLVWMLILLVLFGTVGISESFAEQNVSIQKTVDVDKESLFESLYSLENYSQILPKYIQSSRIIAEDTGKMKVGLSWLSFDADVRSSSFDDTFTLEVISGDFEGTTLHVTMTEDMHDQTHILAELDLQRNWHMGMLTSFVSDGDIKSMLHTSLDGLVEYTKNPSAKKISHEKEKFCIFGFCI